MAVFDNFAAQNAPYFEGNIIQVWLGGPPPTIPLYTGAFYVSSLGYSISTSDMFSTYHRREGNLIQPTPPSFYISTKRGSVLEVYQNTARVILVFMRALDTGAGLSGLTPTMVVRATKNGAAGAVLSPTITDLSGSVGAGWYALSHAGSDFNTLGEMAFHITALAALPNDDVLLNVTAMNKMDGVRGGLTALPNANAGLVNGLPVQGGSIPNANAGAVGGLGVITAVGQGPGGQIKANSFNDKYVYDSQGRMTSCRMRVFANKATADTAANTDTDGAHGEVERFRVTVTYNTDGTIKTYEYAKEL